MILFNSDYTEGAHERILRRLVETNLEQTPGYGCDDYCLQASEVIRKLCKKEVEVHFLVGGTQTNVTVIASLLRPYQGVLASDTGHIAVHETGAVEGTGHKVLILPAKDGKIFANQVEEAVKAHREDGSAEHIVQPKMVYISQPTELGTLYKKSELSAIYEVCTKYGLYLFVDGARLAYGLEAADNDVTLSDLASLCDVFYIGGTKVGALFGEAVVIANPSLGQDFRYMIKHQGAMLAKGRLLGLQFLELLKDGLYWELGQNGDKMADKIREALREAGYPLLVENRTNQVFPILPDKDLARLSESFGFEYQKRIDASHSAVRFCTGWATTEAQVQELVNALQEISRQNKQTKGGYNVC